MSDASEELDALLDSATSPLEESLKWFLGRYTCDLGTVHRWDQPAQRLRLAAALALPEPVREKVLEIPIGKGMAGLAAERLAPVHVCNLQEDESGTARPGARATGMEGAIAVPILDAAGALRGVLGIAQATPREWSEAEGAELISLGRVLVPYLD